jgi:urate oxidase
LKSLISAGRGVFLVSTIGNAAINPVMRLVSNRYGKRRVRVLKVLRDGPRHDVKELDVACLLAGDFDASYLKADNGKVVPTDTVKNTVTVLAHQKLGRETERFAVDLVHHFTTKYAQVQNVHVEISERMWLRHSVGGTPHAHTFAGGSGFRVVEVEGGKERLQIDSGVDDLLIMKSTGSGFAGYPRCDLTTLPETNDRILATRVRALWRYKAMPPDFNATSDAILDAMLRVFAGNFSASVQATMKDMAEAAFQAAPEISRISLALPNKHYLLANLKPFGLENPNVTFVPTDEPHGQIEAVFER